MDKLNYVLAACIRGFMLGAMLACYYGGCFSMDAEYIAGGGLYAIAYAVMVRRCDDGKIF